MGEIADYYIDRAIRGKYWTGYSIRTPFEKLEDDFENEDFEEEMEDDES